MRSSANLGHSETSLDVALFLDVAKALSAMVSLNKATAEKLGRVVQRARDRFAKAYAEYALYELAKLNRLEEAVVNELGIEGLSAEGDEAKLLGEAFVNLATQLHTVLDELAQRIDVPTLIRFTEVAEPLLKLVSLQMMAYAKVVEDYSTSPPAARALRRTSKDLLHLAAKVKLMRSALHNKQRFSKRI